MVKNWPTMEKTWVQSPGWEDPLEKRMATHSSILAWRAPWTEEPGQLQAMGLPRTGHDLETNAHTHSFPQLLYFCMLLSLRMVLNFSPHFEVLDQKLIILERPEIVPLLGLWKWSEQNHWGSRGRQPGAYYLHILCFLGNNAKITPPHFLLPF